jgi:hypothetical protein
MKEEKVRMEFEEILENCRRVLTQAGKYSQNSKTIGDTVPNAKIQFFGADLDENEIPGDKAQRFLEWFLIDRVIPGSGSPLLVWIEENFSSLEPELRLVAKALERSLVGVFKIVSIQREHLGLEDALGRGRFKVVLPRGEHNAREGDCLAGRIVPYPKKNGFFFAMESTQVLKGERLFSALAKQAQFSRKEKAKEFFQLELEQITHIETPLPKDGLKSARKALGAFLNTEPELPSLDLIEEALRSVSSPGKVLDPFLEAVAFHTQRDIGEARRLGLQLWNALQVEGEQPNTQANSKERPESAKSSIPKLEGDVTLDANIPLGQKVLQELEAGEARGEDLETLFNRLGKMVGLEKWESEDSIPKKVLWSTSEVGDLAGLFLEFRWETEQGEGSLTKAESQILSLLSHSLQKGGETFVGGVPRLKWARFLLELWTQGGNEACRNGIGLLTKLSRWLEKTQEIVLDFPTKGFLDLWDQEAARCGGIEGATSSRRNNGDEGDLGVVSVSWFVRGKEGDSWVLESGNRRMALPGTLALVVGDRVFGRPVVGAGTFEEGFRILPSCLALLAMEEV